MRKIYLVMKKTKLRLVDLSWREEIGGGVYTPRSLRNYRPNCLMPRNFRSSQEKKSLLGPESLASSSRVRFLIAENGRNKKGRNALYKSAERPLYAPSTDQSPR